MMPLCKSLSNIFLSILHKPQPLKTCLSFFSRNNNSKSCLLQLKPLRNFIKSLTKTAQLFLKMTLMLNQMICFSQGDMFSSWFSSSFAYYYFFSLQPNERVEEINIALFVWEAFRFWFFFFLEFLKVFVGDLLDCRGPLFYYFKFYFLEFLTEGVC